jgi:hypothetical protein
MRFVLALLVSSFTISAEAIPIAVPKTQPSVSSEHKALIEQSRVPFRAFECSKIAAMMGDDTEANRLGYLGMTSGVKFLKNLRAADRATIDVIAEGMSMFWMSINYANSDDFVLGQVYSIATNPSLNPRIREIIRLGKTQDGVRALASIKFYDISCLTI